MPRPLLGLVLTATLALAAPATAGAAWSGALDVPDGAHAGDTSRVAVNAEGDLAVAWSTTAFVGPDGSHADTSTVRVAMRRAGSGQFKTRTLVTIKGRVIGDVAMTMDARGEITVVWTESANGGMSLRSAYRNAAGGWSAIQTVRAHNVKPAVAGDLRLAAAPDGTVALTFATRQAPIAIGGTGTAWRSAGHRFGATATVPVDRALLFPLLQTDAAGTFYLAGISRCTGLILTATARGRKFGAPRTIAPPPVLEMRLAVTGRGSATVAWLSAGCNSYEPFGGVPKTASIRNGALTPVAGLGDPHGLDIDLAGGPLGSEASWLSTTGPLRTASISPGGTPLAPQDSTDGWGAAVADAAGNRLVTSVPSSPAIIDRPLGARATGATTVQVAPVMLRGSYWRSRVTGAADGAGLAAITFSGLDSHLIAALWRP